jgi:hypothetical protein
LKKENADECWSACSGLLKTVAQFLFSSIQLVTTANVCGVAMDIGKRDIINLLQGPFMALMEFFSTLLSLSATADKWP